MRAFLLALALGPLAGCPSSTALDAGLDAPGLDAPPIVDDVLADVPVPPDVPSSGCVRNSECVIRAETCCGTCGAATEDDWIALHVSDLGDYSARVCEGVGCPECAMPDDPMLVASCELGACVGLDLRTSPLTECSVASDCVLGPRQCCDCGVLGVEQSIAYNPTRGSPYDLVCDDDMPACPPCVPTFDAIVADCVGGRCVAVPAG